MQLSEETQRRLEGASFCAVIALIVVFIIATISIDKKYDYQKKQPSSEQTEQRK